MHRDHRNRRRLPRGRHPAIFPRNRHHDAADARRRERRHRPQHADRRPSGPDGEVALDIEIAGAIAPAAKIAVYFAPNSDAGFIQAVNAAVNDTTNKPSVISISWGGRKRSGRRSRAGVPPRAAGGRRAGHHGVRGIGRQRFGRRAAGRRRSCRLPASARTCSAAAAHNSTRCPGRASAARSRGTTEAAGGGAGGVASARCSTCRRGSGAETHARRWQQRTAREAGRAGCGGRRVAADGLRSVDRGHGHGDGRHERGRAAVSRVDCADQCGGECGGGRCDCRLDQSGALQESGCAARHHAGIERYVRGRAGLGCVYGPRQPERRAARRDPDAQAVELTAAGDVFPYGAGFRSAPFLTWEQHDGHRFRIFRRRVSAASRRPQLAWRAADHQPGRAEPRARPAVLRSGRVRQWSRRLGDRHDRGGRDHASHDPDRREAHRVHGDGRPPRDGRPEQFAAGGEALLRRVHGRRREGRNAARDVLL